MRLNIVLFRFILVCALFFAAGAQEASAQTVEDDVRSMREEIRQLRQELDALKQELHPASPSSEPVPAEILPVIQSQLKEQAQTKVESTSKFPMRLFGTILSNTFWNDGEANWLDLPNIVAAGTPGLRSGSFSSNLRQTRLGANLDGPAIGPMKTSGVVAFDFFGGIPNFQTGQVMALPRLLYAFMRFDSPRTAIEIGQDQMILAPRNPTSLASMSFPALFRSGNLYLRAPQIRVEHTALKGTKAELRVVGGILAPIAGDAGDDRYLFVPPNLAGERSRMPAFQTRISFSAPTAPTESPRWELGASGHYSRERYITGTVPSFATAFDFDATAGRLGGAAEFYAGQNIDAFGGSIAQRAKSHGGFAEVRLSATSRWSFNGGYGTDRLVHLETFPAFLSRNSGLFGNTIYQFTPEVGVSFEYQRLATKPVSATTRFNNHFNLTVAYGF